MPSDLPTRSALPRFTRGVELETIAFIIVQNTRAYGDDLKGQAGRQQGCAHRDSRRTAPHSALFQGFQALWESASASPSAPGP
jgi:hypothetical protein